MQCYTVDGSGLDGLRLVERPMPGVPGWDEVLIDVYSVSLNYRDILAANGQYGAKPETPFIAASDMAGEIIQVGPGVTEFKPGDRVVNLPFRYWPAGHLNSQWIRTLIGGSEDGVLAHQLVYPAESLALAPYNLNYQEASTLPIAGLTAWAAVVAHGRLRPGEWMLAHGTGGVAVFAAQLAKKMGAKVILTTSDPKKADLAKEWVGVDEVVDYRDMDWPEHVRKLTGKRGVDVVVETAGGTSLRQSVKACGYGARIGLIGNLAGRDASFDAIDLMYRQITVRGIFMESCQELRALCRAIEAIDIHPYIDTAFPFTEARKAYEHMQSRQHFGKVVIEVRPS
jgi:NADPH:quinone reductase-like Zn-dependent oxidoreductase